MFRKKKKKTFKRGTEKKETASYRGGVLEDEKDPL